MDTLTSLKMNFFSIVLLYCNTLSLGVRFDSIFTVIFGLGGLMGVDIAETSAFPSKGMSFCASFRILRIISSELSAVQ
jgi:hypothetical protein